MRFTIHAKKIQTFLCLPIVKVRLPCLGVYLISILGGLTTMIRINIKFYFDPVYQNVPFKNSIVAYIKYLVV